MVKSTPWGNSTDSVAGAGEMAASTKASGSMATSMDLAVGSGKVTKVPITTSASGKTGNIMAKESW